MPPPSCPGLTRTEQLRRARTQAALREHERREQLTRPEPDPIRSRPRRPPRPEPKRVDFTKPGLTKAMIAKMKHSEKFKQELERKAEATVHTRVPKRTPAPIGGDARAGRERSVPRTRRTPGPSRGTSPGPVPRATTPKTPVPRRTAELARMMNADVVQAEPVGTGPIENIVIPSGLVSDRPTIVNITPPAEPAPAEARAGTDIANQSIQVINQTLDEQDAAEAAAVQGRLADLQQARRDFVIAVANVGGNAVHLEDDQPPAEVYEPPPVTPIRPVTAVFPESPPVYLERIQPVEDPVYRMDHPNVVAALEHLRKVRAEMRARDAHRRLEEEFARIQAETDAANIPIFVEDIPPEPEFYEYPPFDPEDLERFFDVQRYPPSPCGHCGGPPPERAHLPRDLWELEDPWARPPPEPDVPDMIQFD